MSTTVQTLSNVTAEAANFYDRRLIQQASPVCVHGQFGVQHPVPLHAGNTIVMRKLAPLTSSNGGLLTEGETPDGDSLSIANVTVALNQYGNYVSTSDMLNLTAVDPIILSATKILAADAGNILDEADRDVLVGGTNVAYAGGHTARNQMLVADVLTIDDVKKAVRTLEKNNAPKFADGCYVGIIHPSVKFDLMKDSSWQNPNTYAGTTNIFKGEIGSIYGVRFVMTGNAKVWAKAGATPSGGSATDKCDVYGTLIMGQGAYGITELEGNGLKMFVHQLGSGGTSDPLDQRATIGWKAIHACKILVPEYLVRVESAASV